MPPPPCRQALKNAKFRHALLEVILEAGVQGGCSKQTGALLYFIAGKVRSPRLCRSRVTSPPFPPSHAYQLFKSMHPKLDTTFKCISVPHNVYPRTIPNP